MKKEAIVQYYNSFEAATMNIDGVECWSARELQQLLGYSKWENAGHEVADHFPDVRKMSTTPKIRRYLGVFSSRTSNYPSGRRKRRSGKANGQI